MIPNRLKELLRHADRLTGKRLSILASALEGFSDARAAHAAAALSYYALLSLFPLILVLVAGGSQFLASEQVYLRVTRLFQQTLPVSPEVIDDNLRQVLELRGTVGLLGLLALLWPASSVFTHLAHNVSLAWPPAARRNSLQRQLAGLAAVAGLSLLFVLSLVLDGAAKTLHLFDLPPSSAFDLQKALAGLLSWLVLFVSFFALYRWIPASPAGWGATLLAALVASAGWKLASAGFAWFLESGLVSYRLIYGSLGALVAFLLLIYALAAITLFSAHLCTALDRWRLTRSP